MQGSERFSARLPAASLVEKVQYDFWHELGAFRLVLVGVTSPVRSRYPVPFPSCSFDWQLRTSHRNCFWWRSSLTLPRAVGRPWMLARSRISWPSIGCTSSGSALNKVPSRWEWSTLPNRPIFRVRTFGKPVKNCVSADSKTHRFSGLRGEVSLPPPEYVICRLPKMSALYCGTVGVSPPWRKSSVGPRPPRTSQYRSSRPNSSGTRGTRHVSSKRWTISFSRSGKRLVLIAADPGLIRFGTST